MKHKDFCTEEFNTSQLQAEETTPAKQDQQVKHKDFCIEGFNTNHLQTERTTRTKQDQQAKIEDLKMTIKTLLDELATLKSENSEMKVQLERAGEDRETEVSFNKSEELFSETEELLNETERPFNEVKHKHKDFCAEEFNTNQLQTEEKVDALIKKMKEFFEANAAEANKEEEKDNG